MVAFPGPLLLPQRYSITVSVYSSRAYTFHDCRQALIFDVQPAASQVYSAEPNRVGVLQILCNWNHRLCVDESGSLGRQMSRTI